MRFRALYLRQPWFLSFQFQEFVEALLDLSAEPPARTRRSYFSSLGVFAAEGDQHRGRRRSDVNQRKRLGSPNTGQRQYERERMFGAEADYDRAYGGLVPRGFRGQAAYFGPTFHYQINEKIDLSAAFLIQAPAGRLDFDDFPRQLAKLRLEVDF
jgi:hypothetical protein